MDVLWQARELIGRKVVSSRFQEYCEAFRNSGNGVHYNPILGCFFRIDPVIRLYEHTHPLKRSWLSAGYR